MEYSLFTDDARVFIFPSSRKFYKTELEELNANIEQFLEEWMLGDVLVNSHFKLKYDRFLIFFVDQKQELSVEASNKLSDFMQLLEKKHDLVLLDKLNVCFKQGEHVQYQDLKDFKKLAKVKSVSPNTIIFNNLINTKVEFEYQWEIPAIESWHKRFFPKQ
ncbi:MAG: ABC transporter ATPase [Flavobacteriaceae bacterium]|nr:ABC transporter ATPase [Flavobacteriaceae bacterium]